MDQGRAHVLFQIDPGHSPEAVRYLAGLPSVTEAVMTTGAYDIIATVQVSSDEMLSRLLAQARRAPGLCALRLCRVA